jgi:hypothetical protein
MFCLRKGLDFYRNTWREYVLMCRAHDEDRLDQFEYARLQGYCSLIPYMEKGTTIQKFWSIPARDNNKEDDEEKRSEAKKFMDEVTAKYKEFYNR